MVTKPLVMIAFWDNGENIFSFFIYHYQVSACIYTSLFTHMVTKPMVMLPFWNSRENIFTFFIYHYQVFACIYMSVTPTENVFQ